MNQDLVVIKLDRANQALSEAKTIQETKHIMDVAGAMKLLARRQRLSEETVRYAQAVETLALDQLGRCMAGMPKATGKAGPGRGKAGSPAGPAFVVVR